MPYTDTELAEIEEARMYLGAALAAKGEDYVYEENPSPDLFCTYLDWTSIGSTSEYTIGDPRESGACTSGSPSCIVGHVFTYAGLDVDTIAPLEGSSASVASRILFTSNVVIAALDLAQTVQDDGGSWGEAVWAFETRIAAGA